MAEAVASLCAKHGWHLPWRDLLIIFENETDQTVHHLRGIGRIKTSEGAWAMLEQLLRRLESAQKQMNVKVMPKSAGFVDTQRALRTCYLWCALCRHLDLTILSFTVFFKTAHQAIDLQRELHQCCPNQVFLFLHSDKESKYPNLFGLF